MADVRGVVFPDGVTPAVQDLLDRFIGLMGEERFYRNAEWILFAMQPPGEGVADGIILRIGPKYDGALLRRAAPPKTGPREVFIRADTIDEAFDAGRIWFEEMQQKWSEPKSTKRNPAWTRDELILALDLYFRVPPWTVNATHPAIQELSETLGRLAAADRNDAERYRNVNGTYMKMMNLQYRDPTRDGRGLKGGGALEAEVWQEFGSDREKLSRIAATIRAAIADGSPIASELSQIEQVDEIDEAVEGAIFTRLHRLRERNQKIVTAKKSQVMAATGKLEFETCTFNFAAFYGELGVGYIECHHTKPLAELTVGGVTKLADLALVCANCHRIIHRARKMLSIPELRTLLVP